MSKFEVTIRYRNRKKKNKVVIVECEPEFVIDWADDEVSITIKRLDDGISESG